MSSTVHSADSDVPRAEQAPAAQRGEMNIGATQRLLSLAGGAVLALWGLGRGGATGAAGTLAGGALIIRGATGWCPVESRLQPSGAERRTAEAQGWSSAAVTVRSVTIARPRHELYAFWRDLPNLARFMRHVERIETLDDTRSRWTVKAPGGRTVTWEALITEDVPDERIAWATTGEAEIRSAGSVTFRDAPGGRGTEVRAEIAYEPPAGQIGRAVARLWGEEPSVQAAEDLHRLKQIFETGAVATSQMRPASPEMPS